MATLSLTLVFLSFTRLATGLAFNRTLRHPARRSLGFDPNQAFTKTVISVGDLHSRFDNAVKVLQMAEVIDAQLKWTSKADVLVQTGDIFDRCVGPAALSVCFLTRLCIGEIIRLRSWNFLRTCDGKPKTTTRKSSHSLATMRFKIYTVCTYLSLSYYVTSFMR